MNISKLSPMWLFKPLHIVKGTLRLGIEKALELDDCRYLVAELDNKIIGQTMAASEWSDWRNGAIWWMQSVYVNPN